MQSVASSGCTNLGISESHNLRSLHLGSLRSARYVFKLMSPCLRRGRLTSLRLAAVGGGPDDKKSLTRDEEPDQYWQTATERKGENPLKDPLAIIGIVAILLPFVILAVAIATGVVDVNAGKP